MGEAEGRELALTASWEAVLKVKGAVQYPQKARCGLGEPHSSQLDG